MKPLPADPMGQHARFMQAFTDDLLAGDYSAPRAKAVCEINRQVNNQSQGAGYGNVPGINR